MRRRDFIQFLSASPLGLGLVGYTQPAQAMDYTGKYFVFVQADGGWDPTSFCDPKTNVTGQPEINHWARTQGIQQAGNIPFAPFAANANFFNKYASQMLVINGVDAQTGSHTVGVVHNWSGRVSEGYPSMTALLAAANAPNRSMTYLNFGGFGFTANLVASTRVDNPSQITEIAIPTIPPWDLNSRFMEDDDFALIREFHQARHQTLQSEQSLMPRASRNRQAFASAYINTEDLRPFAEAIPEESQLPPLGVDSNNFARQATIAILAFKTGAAVAADMFLGGFDTHQDHDAMHEPLLADLTNGVDHLWTLAEQEGIADRLVVVIGSDFGRTNLYNATNGKDHWPIGSFIVMEKNVPWTNRVVGETDELHFAFKTNPTTLNRDDANGVTIHPKHVHKALRNYLGVGNSPIAAPFPFNNTEDFAFFV